MPTSSHGPAAATCSAISVADTTSDVLYLAGGRACGAMAAIAAGDAATAGYALCP